MPTQLCIFCGKDEVTKEHLFPKWLYKVLPAREQIQVTSWYAKDNELVRQDSWQTTRPFEVVSTSVCGDCNSRWMNDLESAARPLLSKMIRGESTFLSPSAQRHIAGWAALKAIVGRYAHTPVFPVSDRWLNRMFTKHLPPETWHILLAKYTGQTHLSHYEGPDVTIGEHGVPRPDRSDTRAEDEAVYMTLVIGQLAIRVLGYGKRLRPAVSGITFSDLFVPIWPSAFTATAWPPRIAIDDDSFDDFRLIWR